MHCTEEQDKAAEEQAETDKEAAAAQEGEDKEREAVRCRLRGDCHAEGYVKGGIVVGDGDFTGPDRYRSACAACLVFECRGMDLMTQIRDLSPGTLLVPDCFCHVAIQGAHITRTTVAGR